MSAVFPPCALSPSPASSSFLSFNRRLLRYRSTCAKETSRTFLRHFRVASMSTDASILPEEQVNNEGGSVRQLLSNLFRVSLTASVPDQPNVEPLIAVCTANAKFGDYQCNNAMGLWSKIKGTPTQYRKPNDIGQAIVRNLPPSEIIESTSVAGPGFVNVKLSNNWIAKRIEKMLVNGIDTWAPDLRVQRAVVDFSSPNIAKEMHVGHLRSTIIGDSIARMLEFSKVDVLRRNHVGDWGTQFGMLIEYLFEEFPNWENAGEQAIGDLQAFYKASKKKFDDDAEFRLRAQQAVVRLQGGESKYRQAWQQICEISRREFAQVYERLGVRLEEKAIVRNLPPSEIIESTSVAGPGFVNVKLSNNWIAKRIEKMLVNGIDTWAPDLRVQRAVVDFSSPNIAKEMHVGHLRSTIIGDSIARMLEFSKVDVLRRNHVGDWGTQFGMLIEYLFEEFPNWENAGEQAIGDLQAFYKASKKKFDDDAEFRLRAQQAVVRLQGGESKYRQAWQQICEISRREFAQVYERLGVRLEEKAIVRNLPPSEIIESTSVAGPGFVNVKLSNNWIAKRIEKMLVNGIDTWAPDLRVQRAVVDFSSPNIAKEMHVGHLRSTIIGDSIARMLEFSKVDVLRRNHVGDWGTQFGMLIEYLFEEFPNWENAGEQAIGDLQAFYKASKKKFDDDAEFRLRAQQAVVRLQGGESKYRQAWQQICEISRREFAQVYERLGVRLEEKGESFYNPYIPNVLKELEEKRLIEESEGARVIFIQGQTIPLIVVKRDGGFNYASTDLAALWYRLNEEKADWIIYVTDVGQSQHFEMFFAAAKRAGWLPDDDSSLPKTNHVGFGLVLGSDGKRFRTRSSEVVRLVELLDEAKSQSKEGLVSRGREEEWTSEELEAAAEAIGYGAIKYADLKNNRLTNYTFSFSQMLDVRGNTAVYLLYAHARICSIIRKSGKDIESLKSNGGEIHIVHANERVLGIHLIQFSEVVEDAVVNLLPNTLCEYLYNLSEIFTKFYSTCRVVGSDEEASRLLLCEAAAVVMRTCFHLLGIVPLYKL